MSTLRIDVWSDIACPWCYVGKRRLEAALGQFPHRGRVEVFWRAFELDPAAPRELDASISYPERLARKYATTVAQAQGMMDRMTAVAAEDGLDFRFDRVRPGNTFDAHRLLHLASAHGLQDALKERLLRAYLTEGEPIGDATVLVRLASEVGLDADRAQAVLSSDEYGGEVREDEARAAELGISGVPFFVFASRYGVSGAQPAEVLRGVLDRVWQERTGIETVDGTDGAACGPEGCG